MGFSISNNMGMDVIRQVHEHTSTAISKDWKSVWANGAATIKMEFIQQIYDII